MFDESKKYKNNGHFFFKPGDNLREVSKDVPNLPGVYYFIRFSNGNIELVYIGKSGSVEQSGEFKKQGLRGRLNNKQEKDIKRQDFFDDKCETENIETIYVYWFVTFNKAHHNLPGYVEGLLLQSFFDVHKCLPEWNRSF